MKLFTLHNGVTLMMLQAKYASTNCIAIRLVVAGVPAWCEENLSIGQIWADVTINMQGMDKNEFTTNRAFTAHAEAKLLQNVMEYLTGKPFPQDPDRYVMADDGMLQPIYKFHEALL